MEKNTEKVLEAEVVIKKVDSEGFIYYETLKNQSTPNWENFHNFLQNLPVKELIIGTVVLSIVFLIPNVCWAKNPVEQEQLIRGHAILAASRLKKKQEKMVIEEAKKMVSMKKITLWNEKLVEFEPTISILKYIVQFVTGQIHTFRQKKIAKLALIEQTKQLAELNEWLSILLKMNGCFIGFSVISQIVEKGKKFLEYFEKNPYPKSKKRNQDDDFLLIKPQMSLVG